MKTRVFWLAAACVVITVVGVQQAQVSALRNEVARLRAAVEKQRRTPAPPSMVVPVQGPGRVQKTAPVFRLIGEGHNSVERGMKADELEQRARQLEWRERQEYQFSPEHQYDRVPPWAEGAIPEIR